ncbi:MAG TPA: hypothetical protein VD813_10450, partial [Pseudonocardia sp.]|nr:hypothetical protein [Pseudonocardia sp.]
REWDAAIVEQVPERSVAWAATSGATNAGAVSFEPLGPGRTAVRLRLEFEPEGIVEKTADVLNVVGRRAEADLERFKRFVESGAGDTGSGETLHLRDPRTPHREEVVGAAEPPEETLHLKDPRSDKVDDVTHRERHG